MGILAYKTSLLILTVLHAATWTVGTTLFSPCPRDKPNGLYAHPTDCATFITCLDGQSYIKSCPEGLHFNPEDQVCDWPENVRCTTANAQEMASFNKHSSVHPGGRIAARLAERFAKGDMSFRCQAEHGAFALPDDCALFVRCSQWRSFLYTCKEQMIFDPKDGRCVPDSQQGQGDGHCTHRSEFRCLAADGVFQDILDNTKYYNCWNFRWYHMSCPRGLIFNIAARWCDYPWNVGESPRDVQSDASGIPLAELHRQGDNPFDQNQNNQINTNFLPDRFDNNLPQFNTAIMANDRPASFASASATAPQQHFMQQTQSLLQQQFLNNFASVASDTNFPSTNGQSQSNQENNFAVQQQPHLQQQHQQPQQQQQPQAPSQNHFKDFLNPPQRQPEPQGNGGFSGSQLDEQAQSVPGHAFGHNNMAHDNPLQGSNQPSLPIPHPQHGGDRMTFMQNQQQFDMPFFHLEKINKERSADKERKRRRFLLMASQ